jgi:hypothetical protein
VKAITPMPMSGSLLIWFGALWCLLCLFFHQVMLIPARPPASIRAVQSFQVAESKICRWAESWLRNATCTRISASAPAISSCSQELPSRMNPVMTPPSASSTSPIRVQ